MKALRRVYPSFPGSELPELSVVSFDFGMSTPSYSPDSASIEEKKRRGISCISFGVKSSNFKPESGFSNMMPHRENHNLFTFLHPHQFLNRDTVFSGSVKKVRSIPRRNRSASNSLPITTRSLNLYSFPLIVIVILSPCVKWFRSERCTHRYHRVA